MPNCRWPNTNSTLTPAQQTIGGSGVAAGSVGVSVAYVASRPSLSPKKQRVYDSATEESVLPPQNQRQKPNNWSNNIAQLLTTPSSPHSGKPRRGVALMYPNAPYFVVIGGHPLGYTILTPYGAEMRDKPIDVLLSMHWIFWHCRCWIWKRKNIHRIFWTISHLWRQGD